ncbi:hypothetical protein HN789_06595 [archaeon]|jgi:hypothetical protein|nr:hypothetical protein [archaeon]MBT4022767.1 hypothetical protein [archaeon]MBT4273039.1 hypothetical protein [archaeon]MBT4461020.1 hypothetical protein [archaeon]MBT4858086.1 hypothetical protein [archaeon]
MESRTKKLIFKIVTLGIVPVFLVFFGFISKRYLVITTVFLPLFYLMIVPKVIFEYFNINISGDYFFILTLFISYLYGFKLALILFFIASSISYGLDLFKKQLNLIKFIIIILFNLVLSLGFNYFRILSTNLIFGVAMFFILLFYLLIPTITYLITKKEKLSLIVEIVSNIILLIGIKLFLPIFIAFIL